MRLRKPDGRQKVLVIASLNWAATARLAATMISRGIEIGVLAPSDHVLHKLDRVSAHYDYTSMLAGAASCLSAIRDFMPAFILPCDDTAVGWLHGLHAWSLRRRGRLAEDIRRVIENSLGHPAGYAMARSKGCVISLARDLGIDTPRTLFADTIEELRDAIETIGLPAVLKSESSWSGAGVRIAQTIDAAIDAFGTLQARPAWTYRLKNFFNHRLTDAFPRSRLSVQQYVVGRPANRAVFCREGRVLAGISVEVLQSEAETSPATVVRVIDHPTMAEAAEKLAAAMRLNGFIGFDFQLDEATGAAKFLEMNPRATQTCHLCLGAASDQIGALAQCLGLETSAARLLPAACEAIALFPQELWRDPASIYLRTAYHDVPWEDLQLVHLSLRQPKLRWRERLQKFAISKMSAKNRLSQSMPSFRHVIADQEPT